MPVDPSHILYSLAIGLFTYHVFWMSVRIYQFKSYPETYGVAPRLDLADLVELAAEERREIPAFQIVVPAYQETEVIDATISRLVDLNYPRTHYRINVVTYADEPVEAGGLSTTEVVESARKRIMDETGVDMVRSLVAPSTFDGFFPGDMHASVSHIGKGRGLNYALRRIHEQNELDERRYFIGALSARGLIRTAAKVIADLDRRAQDESKLNGLVKTHFTPGESGYIGPLHGTGPLTELVAIANRVNAGNQLWSESSHLLDQYLKSESARHYFEMTGDTSSEDTRHAVALKTMKGKEFLRDVVLQVESMPLSDHEQYALERDAELRELRPVLFQQLQSAVYGDALYQLTKRLNSRWMVVYDADADAPHDVLRHLGGRIMTEPPTMGFQGPVTPLLNYESVHPLCRMGGLWLAFSHSTLYPRLLHNATWAHPLAGTNWCFRIEGYLRDGTLIRDCPYDEASRRFLLYFDPRHLTEDLETGVRNFSDWSVNAAWHPVVEVEQVPPTPSALFRQYTRWSLGTLQTMGYIMRSRLTSGQKAWFLLYPLRVLYASSGPFITIGLITALYVGILRSNPVYAWWTLALTMANVIYIWAFVVSYRHHYGTFQLSSAVNYLQRNGSAILNTLESEAADYDPKTLHRLTGVSRSIREALSSGGTISGYLQSRCLDDRVEGPGDDAARKYYQVLQRSNPEQIDAHALDQFATRMESILTRAKSGSGHRLKGVGEAENRSSRTQGRKAADDKVLQATRLVEATVGTRGSGAWRAVIRNYWQIVIWSIPFIYFCILPFFNAFHHRYPVLFPRCHGPSFPVDGP